MFSIKPKIGTDILSCWNILIPLLASASATFWGVLTIIDPVIGRDWTKLKWISPVPGGKSKNRKSNSPQWVSKIIWLSAFDAMGPLQTTAWSSFVKKPMDIILTL